MRFSFLNIESKMSSVVHYEVILHGFRFESKSLLIKSSTILQISHGDCDIAVAVELHIRIRNSWLKNCSRKSEFVLR